MIRVVRATSTLIVAASLIALAGCNPMGSESNVDSDHLPGFDPPPTAEPTVTTSAIPTGVTAVVGDANIAVSWTPVSGADSYNILRGTASGVYTSTFTSALSSYTDLTTVNGTTYFYAVQSVTGPTASSESAEISGRPIAAPTISSISIPQAGALRVSWGAATGASTYQVSYGTSSGVWSTVATTSTASPYDILGLTPGTTYYVMVAGTNSVGVGASVNAGLETSGTPLGSFSITSVAASTGQAVVNWGASAGATAYTLKRGTVSGTWGTTVSTSATSPSTVGGLTNGTDYYFMVAATNSTGFLHATAEGSATPLAAPTGLTATVTTSSVALSWTGVTGATSYNVLRGTTSGTYTSTFTSTSNSYTDTTASNGTTYFYVVQAVNSGATSSNSGEISGRPIGNFTISGLSITQGSALRVTWAAATGAAAYTVKYGTASGVFGTTASTSATSPYDITGLTPGTTYYVMVTATNAIGVGASVNASAQASGVPMAAFTITSATASSGQVDVAWAASAGSTAYTLKYGTASGVYGSTFSTSATSPSSVTGLSNGTTYYFMVTATNSTGSLNATAEATGNPVGAPSGVTATVGDANIAIGWTAIGGATSYNILRGTASGVYGTTFTSATNSYTDLTAANGTTYYYVVQAVIGGGTSANSSEVSGRPVAAPIISSVTITQGSALRVTWAAATGAAAYTVKYGTATGVYGTTASAAATSPYDITGLTPGTTYYIMVTATNAVGAGASVNATVEGSGIPLGAFSISSVVAGTGQADVTWGASGGASAYTVKRGTVSGTWGTTFSTSATSPTTVTGLTNGTLYYFMVTATNATGSLNATAEVSATPMVAPTGLTAVMGDTSAALSWTAVAGATSYNILRGTSTGVYGTTYTSATNSYTNTTPVNGTTYYYVVQAVNGSGTSSNSSEISGRPVAAPVISTITITQGSALRITWAAATGAAAYTVKYGTATGVYGTTASTTATSPYDITGLTPGTTYYVMLSATNAVGVGASVDAAAEATGVPMAAFTISSVSVGTSGQADVTWGASAGSTAYTVKHGTVSGTWGTTFSTSATSPTAVTGLTNGTTYYFMVTATNATGSLNATAEVSGIPMTIPTGLSATVGDANIALTWTATSGATSYNILRGTVSGTYGTTFTSATNSYTDLTAANGTTYFYVVQAVNAGGTTGNSSEVSGRPISTPVIASLTITQGSALRVTWAAATGAAAYTVKYGTATGVYGTTASTSATSPYDITGLTPGTTYYITVVGTNAVGVGASVSAVEVSGKPLGAFSITGYTPAGTDTTTGTVALTWGSASATSYTVKYGTATGVYGSTFSTTATSPTTVTALTAGTTYYFMVTAVNATGTLDATAEVSQAPYRTFTSNFDFNSSITYGATTGAEISGGVGRLIANDTVDDSTNGVTVPADDFDDYVSKDANITVAGGKIALANTSGNLNGELASTWTPQYASLTGYWKFNGTLGAIANAETVPATVGTDATMSGAAATYTAGKIGNALTYPTNNTTSMLKIGDGSQYNYDTTSFTIAFWYKITSGAHSPKYLISKGVSNSASGCGAGAGWYMYNWYATDPAAVLFNFIDGCAGTGATWGGAGNISRNVWNHLALVFTRTGSNATSTAVAYLNGTKGPPYTLTNLTDASSRITVSSGAGSELRLGAFEGAGASKYVLGVSYDELAIWNTALTNAEIGKIYNNQRSVYSGEFKSRIMDGQQTTSDWTALKFISSLPFGKEISPSGAESGYGSAVNDFSNGLMGYWNFNEASGAATYTDRSGNGNNLAQQAIGWVTSGQPSIFNSAIRWSIYGINAGANAGAIKTSSATLNITGALTVSAWVNSSTASSIVVPEYIARMGIAGTDERYGLWVKPDGTVGYDHYNGTTTETIASAAAVHLPSAWNLITMTRAANGLDVELFVNGTSVKTGSAVTAPSTAVANPTFSVGRTDASNGGLSGMIDELAVWNRVLSGAEITELYKRGVARVKFQVRACSDSTCSTNPSFVGYDGLNSSFFSEQNNNSAPVTGIGTTVTSPFQALWTTIAAGSAGFTTWLAANKNLQYIQYRAILEGDHATYLPDITSVSLLPQPRYVVSTPYAYNNAATAISYRQITAMTVTGATCTGGTMKFELSDDGAAWKYWTGAAWAASTGYTTANSAATLAALTTTNWSTFPYSVGTLYVRAYLPSSGSTSCQVDNIQIDGYNP